MIDRHSPTGEVYGLLWKNHAPLLVKVFFQLQLYDTTIAQIWVVMAGQKPWGDPGLGKLLQG